MKFIELQALRNSGRNAASARVRNREGMRKVLRAIEFACHELA
jgi:hypothetical protein